MIKHYLKVAFRNLAKYKTQTLVSIIGNDLRHFP